MKPWYEALFDNYAATYDAEVFTQGTTGECDFLENELGRDRKKKILDIGCGTGRHAVELAGRGYSVTGIDLSESQLAAARGKAAAKSLNIEFRRHDAREPHFNDIFDLAIMLCEGGFPLMETDEMNFRILENASRSLKPGGRFIFTTLSGLFPLFHSVRAFMASGKSGGLAASPDATFDLMTFRNNTVEEFMDDSGGKKSLKCNERYYVPSEITWLLKSLGFGEIGIFGAKLGAFSRNDGLTTEDFEMLVIADKE
jgi:SAM-dependent methyltransferase